MKSKIEILVDIQDLEFGSSKNLDLEVMKRCISYSLPEFSPSNVGR